MSSEIFHKTMPMYDEEKPVPVTIFGPTLFDCDLKSLEIPKIFITIHPWSAMGGSESNTIGIARSLAREGYYAVTFPLPPSGIISSVIQRHSNEIRRIKCLIKQFIEILPKDTEIILLGSSAGAAQAGACLEMTDRIVAGIFLGYTWGRLSSLIFGSLYNDLRYSRKSKLFIMGDCDEFTSVSQLKDELKRHHQASSIIVEGKTHFDLESSEVDSLVVQLIIKHYIHDFKPETQILIENK